MNILKKGLILISLMAAAFFLKLLPEFILGKFGIVIPFPAYPFEPAFIIAMGCILAPILEEMLFRGPIYLAIKIKQWVFHDEKLSWKFRLSVILPLILLWAGFLFGLAHMGNFKGELPAGIWLYVGIIAWHGVVFGLLVYKTRSLLPAIFLHSLGNFLAFFVFNTG